MSNTIELKRKAKQNVEEILSSLIEVKNQIGENPELGSEEYESSKLLVDLLKKHDFKVEYPFAGMDTAFKAVYQKDSDGPIIAILAEYDALPGVGHGCGHNIIGTAGVGAGIAVSKLMDELKGEIWVIGTPAEEGHGPSGGAKVRMVKNGVFDDVDVSFMIHPMTGKTVVSANFLAVKGINLEFHGKTSHAAADPQEGVNALNAAVLTYIAIHANRQQLRRDANAVIHGIIKEGGLASNVIPDRAVLQFGVRSSDDTYIPTLIDMVEKSARGSAMATGCTVEIQISQGLKSNIRNKPLEDLFLKLFKELDVKVEDITKSIMQPPGGSTDFADVTHIVPGIHPMIGITNEDMAMHSTDFADVTITSSGDKGVEIGAKVMALATVEILKKPELLEVIKDYFNNHKI
ncbi:amidohydrolase [Candidatus Bathyarchaeota archaeon]|nr:amidohydrolase [Candidatus Bathyarchaeota archaeon]